MKTSQVSAVLALFASSALAVACGSSDSGQLTGGNPNNAGQGAPSQQASEGSGAAGSTATGQPAGGQASNGQQGITQGATGTPTTVSKLTAFQKAWVVAEASPETMGPTNTDGSPKIGKDTGAGVMDPFFAWDKVGYAADQTKVNVAALFTRSAATRNNDNSYMQGAVAIGTLNAAAPPTLGQFVALPNLNGYRPFMRPNIAFTDKYVLMIAASEDNNSNNGNPKPVAFLADKLTGKLVGIANNTRGGGVSNLTKPTDLISQAIADGINVPNANNQRGPHSMQLVPDTTNSFVVGMQYNNQAQEAFRVTVTDAAAGPEVHVNWLQRYSNNARHCRPQVAIDATTKTGFASAVEANQQPAEIGFRITSFNLDTGKAIKSVIAVRSQPQQRLYVTEPDIDVIAGGQLAVSWGLTNAQQKNNQNGHGNTGAPVSQVALFDQTTLAMNGTNLSAVSAFSRHARSFVTTYGPNATPAIASISGSSDGQRGSYMQLIPLTADNKLDTSGIDFAKSFQNADYADVANVQARGKNNPNDQARGFLDGVGDVPNPGYANGDAAKAQTNFMPESKTFSASVVTGYTSATTAKLVARNSLYLTLTPGGWTDGLSTAPANQGQPSSTPGTNPDGTGPAPTTVGVPANTGTGAGSDGTVIPENGSDPNDPSGSRTAADSSGCSATGSSSTPNALIFLAVAGVLASLRRKREEA